jgi:hypothetical protein
MSALQPLEKSLDDIFGKQAPALPPNGKKFIVQVVPWLSLIGGLFTLYSAYLLWNWAHTANTFIDYANSLSAAYGGPQVASSRLSVGIWIGLAVLVVEGLLYVLAFPGTKDRKKSGWNLLFYAMLINIAYGLVIMFTSYGGVGSLIGTLIGSAIGFYFLFQIRGNYSAAKSSKKA